MKSAILVFFVLLLLAGSGAARDLTAENRASFDLVRQTVEQTHFDPSFGGRDWRTIVDRYASRISVAGSIEGFERLTNEMLFELGVSHLLVATEARLKTYMPVLFAEGAVGVDVRWMAGRAVVTRVEEGSAGQVAGLTPGCVIVGIDDRDVGAIVREAEAMPPFNPRNRSGGIANFISGRICGPPGTPVAVAYLDASDQQRRKVLIRRSRGVGRRFSEAMPPVFVEFEARRLDSNIGYVRFNHFADPVDRELTIALGAMAKTRGLVIDLRSNPGGYFKVMDAIIAQLIAEPAPLYSYRYRDETVHRTLTPVEKPYRKPVAVLVDVTTLSSSELFAACLQAVGRAVVVGERSPGYLLGARWIRLPNGLSFMHTVLQPIPIDGRIVEGEGVVPDIEIAPDRDALRSGRDVQLEAAIAALTEGR